LALLFTAGVNIAVCYRIAQPVHRVGILLPGLVPAAVAALLALLFAPTDAAPIAYIAGVAGPLIVADLMHLREVRAEHRRHGQHRRGRDSTASSLK
jgi:uncharacterized membrane protein